MPPTDPPDAAAAAVAVRRYQLVVHPSPPGPLWHATLIAGDNAQRLEFDTPEALAQHLRRTTSIERRRGLR